jgi:hypothetical protein
MNDSNRSEPNERETLDALAEKRAHNREQRHAAIKRWVAYVKREPPEVWGEQLNTLIEAQLTAAQESDLPVEHYDRLERAGRQRSAEDE